MDRLILQVNEDGVAIAKRLLVENCLNHRVDGTGALKKNSCKENNPDADKNKG